MDKVCASPEDSIADMQDGASVAISGFGTSYGFACSLLVAAREKNAKNLTVVSNGLGAVGQLRGMLLVENRQVSKLIVSFSSRPGIRMPADEQIEAGEIEVELVPQGILVERMRAAGAGVPAFYSPTGVGTPIAEGKEVREFNGKPYVLEHAIHVDYAFIRAYRADRLGNLEIRGSSKNFTPSFAKAAKIAIVEVDEIVDVGEIPPENVGLPGIFVTRVVKATVAPTRAARPAAARPTCPRSTTASPPGRAPRWRAAPPPCCQKAPTSTSASAFRRSCRTTSRTATSSCTARTASSATARWSTATTSTRTSSTPPASTSPSSPGASFFDSVTSFEMARGGRIDAVLLGAYEVDQDGNLANYSTGDPRRAASAARWTSSLASSS